MWRPVWRRRDSHSGFRAELENLDGDAKGKGTSGENRKAESTDVPARGGLLCSSDEAGVMPVERREQAIAIGLWSTGNGRNLMLNGRRQPSCDGTSRMMREHHVRFCEGLGVKFPGSTRPSRQFAVMHQFGSDRAIADVVRASGRYERHVAHRLTQGG